MMLLLAPTVPKLSFCVMAAGLPFPAKGGSSSHPFFIGSSVSDNGCFRTVPPSLGNDSVRI